MANKLKILVAPTHVEGTLGRIVEFPDGSVVTQIWEAGKWVTDRSKVISVLKGRRAGKKTMTNFQIPEGDRLPGELP